MASEDQSGPSFQFPFLPVKDDAVFAANSEPNEIQRAAVRTDDDFNLLVQVDLSYVAHGRTREGPATLLVIRFRLIGVTLNRRLRNVNFVVGFRYNKNKALQNPIVRRLWPEGYFALNTAKAITIEASTDSTNSTPKTATWAKLSRNAYDVEDRVRLEGYRDFWGGWVDLSLSDNKTQGSAPVIELRTAMILNRSRFSKDESFEASISVGAKADWLTPLQDPKGPIQRFLRTSPVIDTIPFNPKDPPLGHLKDIPVDTDNLDIAFREICEVLATTDLAKPGEVAKDEDKSVRVYRTSAIQKEQGS
ncbi:hypothetical protein GGR51DRAFT_507582 [Nemania sp. FL0031]|nr:hypothetical protein GGR51DRAFT_507582 [Nemania sp. FL0031]